MAFYIDVIIPLPLEKLFTYKVSSSEATFLQPGMRVAVPFGKQKLYTGVVHIIHKNAPEAYEAKEIDQILDESPTVAPLQLAHWFWLAEYYLCAVGEVMKAALPSALLLESETLITKSGTFIGDETLLNDDEWLVFEALTHQSVLKAQDVMGIVNRKNVLALLKKLLEKNIIYIKEEVVEQYRPKMVTYVKIQPKYASEETLKQLLEELQRAPKQREVLMHLFMLEASLKKPIKQKELEEKSNTTAATINALVEKGILLKYALQTDRVSAFSKEIEPVKTLTQAQQEALLAIEEGFAHQMVVLLHGVTSSGKTEVYAALIEKYLEQGKQVLFLLPEIALTTQLISRLQTYFGNKVSVYHSKYSTNERVEVYNNVLVGASKAQIVIGARSALLLPFINLGLVVVDEEHEPSYKQFDPAPRYHARDAAIVLAKMHSAKVLLGSATPSLESYYNAKSGKYGLVNLDSRYGKALLPEVELVDLKEKNRKKQMKGHFSDRLLQEIEHALQNKEQVILFQNRRGYAPIVECLSCGHAPQCPNCDVSLTLHQQKQQLRCHYCGFHTPVKPTCMACGNANLNTKGFGTEQVEEELQQLFSSVSVARMDSDATTGKHGYEKIIEAFESGEVSVLVGTQMLTKGLDFKNVSLVGVMNADTLLNIPDFRSHERAYQLVQQVSGRAGRAEKRGKVIVQTYNPYHQILQQASLNRYVEMYLEQLEQRRIYKYPPFYRLIKITFKNKDFNKVNEAALWFQKALSIQFNTLSGVEILGPEFPPVARIKNQYLKNVLIKIPVNVPVQEVKMIVKKIGNSFNAIANYRTVKCIFNVDNY